MKPRKKSPRLSRSERTERILEAARRIFEAQGYEKARVTEIANQVGVVEGTVFHYFGSKRRLMLSVIARFYREITTDLETSLQAVLGTRNRLHFIIRFHLNVIRENAELCAVILRESRGIEEGFVTEIHQLNRRYTNCLMGVLQEGVSAGEIRQDCPPSLVRDTIYGSLEHLLWNYLTERKPLDVESCAQDLTELVFRGAGKRSDSPMDAEAMALVKKLNQLLAS